MTRCWPGSRRSRATARTPSRHTRSCRVSPFPSRHAYHCSHPLISDGGMIFIRAQMIGNISWSLAKASTIATRYLHIRRQVRQLTRCVKNMNSPDPSISSLRILNSSQASACLASRTRSSRTRASTCGCSLRLPRLTFSSRPGRTWYGPIFLHAATYC